MAMYSGYGPDDAELQRRAMLAQMKPPTSQAQPQAQPGMASAMPATNVAQMFRAQPQSQSPLASNPNTGVMTPGLQLASAPAASAPMSAPIGTSPRGSAPSGWDAGKWNDPNHHSIKYDVGHILQPLTKNGMISQEQIAAAMPEIQKLYPGARASGDGYITPDGEFIDLIEGSKAGNGTGKLQYLSPMQQGGGAGGGSLLASALRPSLSMGLGDLSGSSSTMDQINAEIDALMKGETSPTERAALIQMIRGR